MFTISDKIECSMGGPPLPLECTPDSLQTVGRQEDVPSSHRCHSIYLMAWRNYPLTFLEMFDFPIMAINCTRQSHSTTPLQSLQLLNSRSGMEQSTYLAAQVNRQIGKMSTDSKKIEQAYLLAPAHPTIINVVKFCKRQLQEQRQLYLNTQFSAEKASQQAMASLC